MITLQFPTGVPKNTWQFHVQFYSHLNKSTFPAVLVVSDQVPLWQPHIPS